MSAFFPLHFTSFFISIHLTSSLFHHFFSFLKLGSSPYILVQKPKYFFLTIWNLSSNWVQVLLGSAQFFLVIGKMTLFYYLALPILLPLTLCFIKKDQKFGRGSASSRLVFCWFLTESYFFLYTYLTNIVFFCFLWKPGSSAAQMMWSFIHCKAWNPFFVCFTKQCTNDV